MNEFFNWHDTWVLFEHNWIWFLAALLIGCLVGWWTCETVPDLSN